MAGADARLGRMQAMGLYEPPSSSRSNGSPSREARREVIRLTDSRNAIFGLAPRWAGLGGIAGAATILGIVLLGMIAVAVQGGAGAALQMVFGLGLAIAVGLAIIAAIVLVPVTIAWLVRAPFRAVGALRRGRR